MVYTQPELLGPLVRNHVRVGPHFEPPMVPPSGAKRDSRNKFYTKHLEAQLRQISEALDTENPLTPALTQYLMTRTSSHSRTILRYE